MPSQHFLNPPRQNAHSQPIDSQRPFDLSPFLAFAGPKCHSNKKNAARTRLDAKTSDKEQIYLTRKSQKSQKIPSYREKKILPIEGEVWRGSEGLGGGVCHTENTESTEIFNIEKH